MRLEGSFWQTFVRLRRSSFFTEAGRGECQILEVSAFVIGSFLDFSCVFVNKDLDAQAVTRPQGGIFFRRIYLKPIGDIRCAVFFIFFKFRDP